MERVTLHHIDRQANAHADRLANAALDRRRTKLECGAHVDGTSCTRTTMDVPTPAAPAMPMAHLRPGHRLIQTTQSTALLTSTTVRCTQRYE
ncbi:reverse transcriptase [Phytophthora megakarya]|uniref:Reverse transcriptase n=1 Tax=Phytophthora megakarya TaxID=4795 RepID=A0A225UMD2_9STRA|nr:reverse transcriptase [Phytophthora megakarya]